MEFLTAFAVYFIIWWMTLFLVLPHGNLSQAEANDITPGTEPGAPVNPRFGRKLIITTLLSLAFYGLYWLITNYFGFSLDNIPSLFPEHLQ
ncbi:MAG: DUF1467 family protein [Rhizobiaceae bacterium]|nr:DUF1467 family protein [Rhizobiaceae bacterium]MBL4695220.1 DUF1467 family protein [Rhizobiaceae bacterium]